MMIVITQLLEIENKDMVLQLATILCCTNCKDNLFSESKDSMQKSTAMRYIDIAWQSLIEVTHRAIIY
jgi:hypothetical protein